MTKDFEIAPQGILWDLDNTLYRVEHAMEQAFNHAIARSAVELGVPVDLPQALAMASESWLKHNFSGRVFIDEHHISHSDLHFCVDKYMDHSLVQACMQTRDLFAKTPVSHALITHAARRWGLSVLDHLGLAPYFPEHAVFGYETYDFQSKARSRKPFEMALAAINKNPEDCVMVEDMLENLRVPHEMGMTTVLIHHGKKPDSLPGFVDLDFDNARALMERVYSSASL